MHSPPPEYAAPGDAVRHHAGFYLQEADRALTALALFACLESRLPPAPPNIPVATLAPLLPQTRTRRAPRARLAEVILGGIRAQIADTRVTTLPTLQRAVGARWLLLFASWDEPHLKPPCRAVLRAGGVAWENRGEIRAEGADWAAPLVAIYRASPAAQNAAALGAAITRPGLGVVEWWRRILLLCSPEAGCGMCHICGAWLLADPNVPEAQAALATRRAVPGLVFCQGGEPVTADSLQAAIAGMRQEDPGDGLYLLPGEDASPDRPFSPVYGLRGVKRGRGWVVRAVRGFYYRGIGAVPLGTPPPAPIRAAMAAARANPPSAACLYGPGGEFLEARGRVPPRWRRGILAGRGDNCGPYPAGQPYVTDCAAWGTVTELFGKPCWATAVRYTAATTMRVSLMVLGPSGTAAPHTAVLRWEKAGDAAAGKGR